jgi:hypothetical protein
MLAELVEQLARRVRTPLQRQRKRRDPFVVVDEFILARIRVVDAIDVVRLQLRVIFTRRPDVMTTAACFVEVVVEIGAGRHETIDVSLGDQVGDHHAHAARAQGAGHPQKDRAIGAEHLFPDAPRRRQTPPLERHALHPREDFVGAQARVDRKRLDRNT